MTEKKLSKQSGGWGTNLWNKYSTDLFFRATCNIIILQLILTAIIVTSLWFMMDYLVRDTSQTLITAFTEMLTGQNVQAVDVAKNLKDVRLDQFWQVVVITSAVILSFGFIMIYMALGPTRLSLERKKRFIGNLSHELRTPLTVMRTNTDLSLLDKEIPQKVRKRLERNIVEFGRISDIMDNVLGLSNLMQNQHLDFKEVNLSEVAQRALDSLIETTGKKDITITLKSHTRETVLGNASAIEQAIFNLLKNALIHIDTEGIIVIEIEATNDGKFVDLSVKDTGCGIPQKDLYHIFEPFYRSSISRRSKQGQGLGLAIVNEIIQVHKGKIKIKSTVGQGTTITISLRRSSQERATDRSVEANDTEEISMDFSRKILH